MHLLCLQVVQRTKMELHSESDQTLTLLDLQHWSLYIHLQWNSSTASHSRGTILVCLMIVYYVYWYTVVCYQNIGKTLPNWLVFVWNVWHVGDTYVPSHSDISRIYALLQEWQCGRFGKLGNVHGIIITVVQPYKEWPGDTHPPFTLVPQEWVKSTNLTYTAVSQCV